VRQRKKQMSKRAAAELSTCARRVRAGCGGARGRGVACERRGVSEARAAVREGAAAQRQRAVGESVCACVRTCLGRRRGAGRRRARAWAPPLRAAPARVLHARAHARRVMRTAAASAPRFWHVCRAAIQCHVIDRPENGEARPPQLLAPSSRPPPLHVLFDCALQRRDARPGRRASCVEVVCHGGTTAPPASSSLKVPRREQTSLPPHVHRRRLRRSSCCAAPASILAVRTQQRKVRAPRARDLLFVALCSPGSAPDVTPASLCASVRRLTPSLRKASQPAR
jgi:hypothetical protein